jgi:hypothetical protein
MNENFSIQLQNGARCKNKWGTFVRNLKNIYDYKIGTRNNQKY